jgi:hypothetical protein
VQDFVRALQGLPLRVGSGEGRSESSSQALAAAVPASLAAEPSAPYAEYSAAQRSHEPRRSDTARGKASDGPEIGVEALGPTAGSLSAASASGLAGAAALMAATASGVVSMPRRLPPQLWLGLLTLMLTAATLFALVLAQHARSGPQPAGLGSTARGGQLEAPRYFAPLLGSR